uniref:Uncharacterized protein MANES_17G119500 n=1 Tax=Rhizophora mucronata TaxID=61149 RepID=A0A2P2KE75_RHIMU
MAAAARGFIISRVAYLSSKPHPPPATPPPPPQLPRHFVFPRRLSSAPSTTVTVSCLSSGGEFVSTRNSGLDRGFSVIENMLKRIEPLDTAVISKGVSDSAKDSMKQAISSMLGLLPSDQFSVTVKVSKNPLESLLISAIITGYTLWNAEYRVSLMRNLDISVEDSKESKSWREMEDCGEEDRESESCGAEAGLEDLQISPRVLGDLSPEALNYIQQLQSELSDAKEVCIFSFATLFCFFVVFFQS